MEDSATGVLSLHRETKFILGFDFAVTPSSPESFSCSFRHHFRTLCRTEVAHVKRRQKMIPFITPPWSACLRVGFWCKMFGLDFWVQIDSIDQPIKSNSVGSGNMSHRRASSLYDHLDHCFAVFKHIQQSFLMRNWTLEGTRSTLSKSLIILRDCLRPWVVWRQTTGLSVLSWFWVLFPETKTIRSHKSRAGMPSHLNPASKEMISDSVELCETEVCFSHIQLVRTN